MGVGVLIALATPALAGDCPPAADAVAEMEAAVLEARWADADAARSRAIASFGCGPLADRAVLARLWLAEAVAADGQGDPGGAEPAFTAAARVSPDTWNPLYGPAFERRWRAAADVAAPLGRIRVEPVRDGAVVAIDGREVSQMPAELPSGLHLAQGGAPAAMEDAQVVFLPPGLDLVVRLDLGASPVDPVAADPAPAPEPSAREKRGFPVLLATSAVAGMGAAVTGGLAVAQNGAMRRADDLEALDRAFHTQQALGLTSDALIGVTAVAFGLHFVL